MTVQDVARREVAQRLGEVAEVRVDRGTPARHSTNVVRDSCRPRDWIVEAQSRDVHEVRDEYREDDQNHRHGPRRKPVVERYETCPCRVHALRIQGRRKWVGTRGPRLAMAEVHLFAQEEDRLGEVGVLERSEDVPALDEQVAILEWIELSPRRADVVEQLDVG